MDIFQSKIQDTFCMLQDHWSMKTPKGMKVLVIE
jgi:hypothetical protein